MSEQISAPMPNEHKPSLEQKTRGEVKKDGDRLSEVEEAVVSELKIAPERAKSVSKLFERKVLAETDVANIVEGIIPAEAVFNSRGIKRIKTASGQVEIKSLNESQMAEHKAFLELFGYSCTDAEFEMYERKITVPADPDTIPVDAISKGNLLVLKGPLLAHEVTHAHQTLPLQYPDEGAAQRIKQAEPDLSFDEAKHLVARSRDGAILQEVQAYILQFSLTGGTSDPDATARVKSHFADVVTKVQEQEASTDTDTQEAGKTIQYIEQMKVDGIPFAKYSENGYPSILELVSKVVQENNYLPEKDQNNEMYLKRIQRATCQIIRLLDKGVGHRQIADLMRNNYDSIQGGREWDENVNGYTFLQEAIDTHPKQEQIDDEELIERFNKRTEERAMRMRAIAKECLENQHETDTRPRKLKRWFRAIRNFPRRGSR